MSNSFFEVIEQNVSSNKDGFDGNIKNFCFCREVSCLGKEPTTTEDDDMDI